MTNVTWTRAEGSDRMIAKVSFGIKDTKGREMGANAVVLLNKKTYRGSLSYGTDGSMPNAHKVGDYYYCLGEYRGKTYVLPHIVAPFSAEAYSTRDGVGFGACNSVEKEYDSLEAAQADALKRVEATRKRVMAKAAKTGGIYT